MLSDIELLRYSRQILLADVDIAGQLKLKQSRALIIGLGGLGSPVALYLAAAGLGHLHLADFDVVDESNLQRQIIHDASGQGHLKVDSAQARLRALNPLIQVYCHNQQLNAENLTERVQGMDVVLDCTDNFRIRDELNTVCVAQRIPWISGAAIRLSGQITLFDPRQADSPCYRCLFAGVNDDASLGCHEAGVLGPLVGLVGSLQALEAIKLLVGFGHSLLGRLLLVDAASSQFRELKLTRDPECPVCGI